VKVCARDGFVAPGVSFPGVMRGLVPRIHACLVRSKAWMAGTRPAMTEHYWGAPHGLGPVNPL
jgi:hypothetical protein